ncbi:MAG: transcription elongation factor GreA [Erysipelotrichaceae bacterium]|nr:transcription elongation factor GreA [Erysipelotrichaceae bacterium]
MAEEKIYLTKEGIEALKNELDHLKNVVRLEVLEELKEARAQGDLSENADYDAARQRQAEVEARIKELEVNLDNVAVISETKGGIQLVKLGCTVTVLNLNTLEVEKFTIVGSLEADPLNGKISNASPLGKAILGMKKGDRVTVKAPKQYDVEIKLIERS